MKKFLCVILVTAILTIFGGSIPSSAQGAEVQEENDLYVLISEEEVDFFGEEYTKKVYELDSIKTVEKNEDNSLSGTGEKIVYVEYVTASTGSSTVNGTDVTMGVSYTLTLNYQYTYYDGIKYCKPTSTSATVDLGPDGTQLDYQYFVLYNTGFTHGNAVGDYVYYTPSYTRYSTYGYCSAPSYFELATKWDGGTFPGNLVDYTLYLKRGTSSHWSASDSISCD